MRPLFLICLLLIAGQALSQSLDKGYYIVIGAFAQTKESYAKKFAENNQAKYGFDTKRKLFLVYLEEFKEFSPSIDQMLSVRKAGKFPEAWVRVIKDVRMGGGEEVKTGGAEEVKTEGTKTPVTTVPDAEIKSEFKKDPISTSEPSTSSPPQLPTSSSPQLIFRMFDANNSKPIDGKIEIIDTERARLIQKNNSTDTLPVPDPKSKSGMLSFITDVFGYRKIQHEVKYDQPVVDSAKHYIDREGDFYVIQFEMVRYHKGDIATLYNVFFFNDAAIMQPESKYELNKLLEMMQSNPNYRIMLHGHTNGNARGKIISMGPSKDFFSIKAPDVREGSGTAKGLSGQRAEVIKEWLIAQGISADRIEVKAWGGRRMIHDKNSANARRNVRVEVEVLSE